jgi:LDH2 family malate/lactate/ureidoglycolate dehydrogenase
MAPWGGIDMLLSTNPIAISVPMGEGKPPVLLDMATTVAAYGKVKMKAQLGQEMPVGWMIDKQGQPLTDPHRSNEGMLVPIGEYKGYGLSLMIALLAGCMNGAAVGSNLVDFNADSKAVTNTGQTIVAINPDFLGGAEHLRQDANRLVTEIKASRKLPGVEEIRVPGDGIAKSKAKRSVSGIPISDQLFAALNATAKQAGVAPLEE